jgi:hypothetical protein
VRISVDFGLFELFATLGLSALAKKIYSQRFRRAPFLIVGVALPALLTFVAGFEEARWLAAGCLGPRRSPSAWSSVALRKGDVPTPTLALRRQPVLSHEIFT